MSWDDQYAFWLDGAWEENPQNPDLYLYRLRNTIDAPLTVLIVDDALRRAEPDGEPPTQFSDPDYLVRAAGNALAHQAVREVLVTNFFEETLMYVMDGWRSEVEQERVCLLLDIYGPEDEEALGAAVAPILIGDGLISSRNCAIFSKKGNIQVEQRFHISKYVRKTTEMESELVFQQLGEDIKTWLDECASFHRSPFRMCVGEEALRKLADRMQTFHAGIGRHKLNECVAGPADLVEELVKLVPADACDEFVRLLGSRFLVESKLGNQLFLPLTAHSDCSQERVFSFSKAMSRRITRKDENAIPSYWLQTLLGLDPTLGVERWAFDLDSRVPVSGFLGCLGYLKSEVCSTIKGEFDESKPQLSLSFCIEANNHGAVGLHNLAKIIEQQNGDPQFSPIQGQTRDAFTALFLAGWNLMELPTRENNKLKCKVQTSRMVYLDD